MVRDDGYKGSTVTGAEDVEQVFEVPYQTNG